MKRMIARVMLAALFAGGGLAQAQVQDDPAMAELRKASESVGALMQKEGLIEQVQALQKAGKDMEALKKLRDFQINHKMSGVEQQVVMMVELKFYQEMVRKKTMGLREVLFFMKQVVSKAPRSYISQQLAGDIAKLEKSLNPVQPGSDVGGAGGN